VIEHSVKNLLYSKTLEEKIEDYTVLNAGTLVCTVNYLITKLSIYLLCWFNKPILIKM